jgi:hypothetical protein
VPVPGPAISPARIADSRSPGGATIDGESAGFGSIGRICGALAGASGRDYRSGLAARMSSQSRPPGIAVPRELSASSPCLSLIAAMLTNGPESRSCHTRSREVRSPSVAPPVKVCTLLRHPRE